MFERLILLFIRAIKSALCSGPNDLAKTILFQILMEQSPADSGIFKWGFQQNGRIIPGIIPLFFNVTLTVADWPGNSQIILKR